MPRASDLYYILSPGYHGASQLSLLLNNHPEILSLGNGNPSRAKDQQCSCGEKVSACPFWGSIKTAIEAKEDDPISHLLPQGPYLVGNPKLNSWINGAISLLANEFTPKAWQMVKEPAKRFFKIQNSFLDAAYAWVPHRILADGEKSVLKVMVMASMDYPVRGVIHVVRDPRAYAAARHHHYPEIPVEKWGLEWLAAHTRIRRLMATFSKVPFHGIRYEDLAANPAEETQKLLDFMGLEPVNLLTAPNDARKHHVLGAEGSQNFDGSLENPEKWREILSLDDQKRVIQVCGPLFSEFGYKT